MPSLTYELSNLEESGPLIDVQIVIPPELEDVLRDTGKEVPSPYPATALIDTGATKTVIKVGIAEALGLQPVGTARITTTTTNDHDCYLYAISIVLPDGTIVDEITAIEAPLKHKSIECLIGRDVLAKSIFVFLGEINQFTLGYFG